MPERNFAANELAELMSAISHPTRIRIIEEIRSHELDVSSLLERLHLNQSNLSQHLRILKDKKILLSRKEGGHVFYSLARPWLANFLIQALDQLQEENFYNNEARSAFKKARKKWNPDFDLQTLS